MTSIRSGSFRTMSPDRLLAHFDQIGEAPDAVPRLRRFILDLAVRGKLVEQDPNDEPASELLKRIQAEKVQLVKHGKIRAPGIALRDEGYVHSFDLPGPWTRTCLGDVAQYGIAEKVASNSEISADTWVLDLEDIEKDTSRLIDHVPASARPFRSTKTIFKRGDVLFGKLRPYLNKVLVADRDGVCTTEIIPIRGYCGMAPQYVRLVLKSPLTMAQIDRLMYGMKMPRLGTSDAVALTFPLPPLSEQHRIAAKVDELMGLCDRLKTVQAERENRRDRLVAASLNRLNSGRDADAFRDHARFHLRHLPRLTTRPEHIKQLRQTILNLAVRGKLVPQDPKDEPATDLFDRIQREKRHLVIAGDIRQQIALRHISDEEIPYALPETWKWARIGGLAGEITSGSRSWAEFYSSTGAKFIRAQNIKLGYLELDSLAHVELPASVEGKRTSVRKDDLLVVITGAGVTNPGMLDDDVGEAYISQHVALVRPVQRATSRWLLICLMATAACRGELLECAYGAGKPGLNLDNIRLLKAPLPPLAEQHRIVAKLAELMALCDDVERGLVTTAANRQQLLEATIQETFVS